MFRNNSSECESIVRKYYVLTELQGLKQIEQICAICACAEQTFSQAKAYGKDFSRAFEVAMDAYMNGDLKGKIKNEIHAKFKPQGGREVTRIAGITSLVDITKAHRLRL